MLFVVSAGCYAQADTTIIIPIIDSTKVVKLPNIYQSLLDSNLFLNNKPTAEAFTVLPKNRTAQDYMFYFIVFLMLLLGLMRVMYSRYFSTLFRVFFNTSLRQNQLTDQLAQAKIPSLFFNIYFTTIAGLYIYLLLEYFWPENKTTDWLFVMYCIIAVALCYLVKFLSLISIGWLTNYKTESNNYIFIVFLINKIIGVFLLPVVLIMAFAENHITSFTVYASIILLAFMLIMRFVRTFSVLQNKLKVSRYHFFMYVFALEILPLLLIYKTVTMFFG